MPQLFNNTITNQSDLYSKVLNSVSKNASNEMSEYLHDKMRKHADEIIRFFHAVVRIFCPMVFKNIFACSIHERDVKIKGTAANCVGLASAIMCRLLNTKASALHYSIPNVLSKLTTKTSFGEKSY